MYHFQGEERKPHKWEVPQLQGRPSCLHQPCDWLLLKHPPTHTHTAPILLHVLAIQGRIRKQTVPKTLLLDSSLAFKGASEASGKVEEPERLGRPLHSCTGSCRSWHGYRNHFLRNPPSRPYPSSPSKPVACSETPRRVLQPKEVNLARQCE